MCFIRAQLFFRTLPSRAHTSSHMSGHHLATGRRAPGRKRGARFESSEALAHWQSCRQWRAQPWSCMDAAPGCRLQRRSSANILTAWPGRVAQAPRAGRVRAPGSCSPCWRPSREPHGSGTSYTTARRFANFQRQRGPAGPWNSRFWADTPRIKKIFHRTAHKNKVWCKPGSDRL